MTTSAQVSPEDLLEVSRCVCFHVRKTARVVTRFFDRYLQNAGLGANQFAVLASIAGAGGTSVTHLAQWLGMDHSTVVRNLRPLTKADWVSSSVGEDRRRRELRLTAAGHAKLSEALPYWREAQEAMEAALQVQEIELPSFLAGLRCARTVDDPV